MTTSDKPNTAANTVVNDIPFTLFPAKRKRMEAEAKALAEGQPLAKIRKRGRPPKADMLAVKQRNKGKIGRPVGDSGRLQEFKERLLATGGTKIIDKVVSIALNDEHPGQLAALKLCLDRVLPASVFEAAKNAGSTPHISINITGLNDVSSYNSPTTVVEEQDVIDV